MVLDGGRRPRRPAPALVRITTSPPSGLNFTALWTRLTTTWPSRARSPRIGRQAAARRRPRASTPCRSANSRSRSADSAASAPMSTPSTRSSVPPPSIRDRSSSSLTIWTRWPVSTSTLAIRSRIRAGTASPAASASRLRVSARRLTVVNGVRSSCDRLSMNSVRIRCRRRSSDTSSRHEPDAGRRGARRARTTRVGPSASASLASAVARALVACRPGQPLDPLGRGRPPSRCGPTSVPGRPRQERVRRGVGLGDAQPSSTRQDARPTAGRAATVGRPRARRRVPARRGRPPPGRRPIERASPAGDRGRADGEPARDDGR